MAKQGVDVDVDLPELWRRIVFSICISSTDDHLRNHGFLLTNEGWKLSPAYDINPEPTGAGLHLNISEHDNTLDLELILEVAEYFGLGNDQARSIVDEVASAVAQWREIAASLGEQRAASNGSAFRVVE